MTEKNRTKHPSKNEPAGRPVFKLRSTDYFSSFSKSSLLENRDPQRLSLQTQRFAQVEVADHTSAEKVTLKTA